MNFDVISKSDCNHDWKNDPMFEDGAVMMFTSMQGEEMRQGCLKCGKVRYGSVQFQDLLQNKKTVNSRHFWSF